MSKEQINLSDALDLIAQSKSDIKDSVEYKGGIIGNDLTEYYSAIDNIEFNTLVSGLPLEPQIGDGTSQIKRYNSATYGLVDADYNDVTMEVLDNYVSAAKPEGWTSNLNNYYDPQAFIFTLEDDGYGKAVIDAEYNNVGWTQIKIHDNVGNVDFIKSYKTSIESNQLTITEVNENTYSKNVTDNGDNTWSVDLEGNNNIEITVTPVINNKNYEITNRDVLIAEYIYDGNGDILAGDKNSGFPDINNYVTISGNTLTVDSSVITNNGYIIITFYVCESTGEIEFDNDSSVLELHFNINT